MMDENLAKSLGALLQGSEKMQEKLQNMQQELAQVQATGSAGGGLVEIVVSGTRQVVKVHIAEEALQDRDMLQDLTAAAITDALQKLETTVNEKMRSSLMSSLF